MPSNINEFDRDLRIFSTIVVPQDHAKLTRKLALEVLRRVVIRTPVDTGRARSNWLVAVNNVPAGTIEIEKFTKDQATQYALSNGIPVIEGAEPFTSISIANNLPYIGVLEFGSSKQAPQGMLRVTLSEIQAQFGGSGL